MRFNIAKAFATFHSPHNTHRHHPSHLPIFVCVDVFSLFTYTGHDKCVRLCLHIWDYSYCCSIAGATAATAAATAAAIILSIRSLVYSPFHRIFVCTLDFERLLVVMSNFMWMYSLIAFGSSFFFALVLVFHLLRYIVVIVIITFCSSNFFDLFWWVESAATTTTTTTKNSTIEANRIGYTRIGEQNESYSIVIAISIAGGCIFLASMRIWPQAIRFSLTLTLYRNILLPPLSLSLSFARIVYFFVVSFVVLCCYKKKKQKNDEK